MDTQRAQISQGRPKNKGFPFKNQGITFFVKGSLLAQSKLIKGLNKE